MKETARATIAAFLTETTAWLNVSAGAPIPSEQKRPMARSQRPHGKGATAARTWHDSAKRLRSPTARRTYPAPSLVWAPQDRKIATGLERSRRVAVSRAFAASARTLVWDTSWTGSQNRAPVRRESARNTYRQAHWLVWEARSVAAMAVKATGTSPGRRSPQRSAPPTLAGAPSEDHPMGIQVSV